MTLQTRGQPAATGLLRQRVPDDVPPAPARSHDWALWAFVAVVVAGVALRFLSLGPMWLDEAQSVAIAKHPLGQLAAGLRHDGSPPLWYALLHLWMRVFGDSTLSVRTLSGIPAVLALPLLHSLGRRLASRAAADAALLLLAVSPFAIRYAVEARMYSLMLMLTLLGAHAVLTAHRRRGVRPVLAVAACASALLYTHYYAVFLLAVLGGGELWWWLRRHDMGARRVVGGLGVAAVSFVPWLPVLHYQSVHTGAPWQPPPDANAILDTVDSWMGGGSAIARLSALFALALVVLAVAGRSIGRRKQLLLGVPLKSVPLRLCGLVLGTLVLAIVVDSIERQAYAPRYLSVGIGLFLLVVGIGVTVLPSRRARRGMLALLAVGGLVVSGVNAARPRSQAAEVAAVLQAQARPGDLIVYCPDQLGPSTSRLLHTGVRQVVFPNFASPHVVDWVDYRTRIAAANPKRFARTVDRMAAGHRVWLVYSLQVRPLTADCVQLIDELLARRGLPTKPVTRDPTYSENMTINRYDARR